MGGGVRDSSLWMLKQGVNTHTLQDPAKCYFTHRCSLVLRGYLVLHRQLRVVLKLHILHIGVSDKTAAKVEKGGEEGDRWHHDLGSNGQREDFLSCLHHVNH